MTFLSLPFAGMQRLVRLQALPVYRLHAWELYSMLVQYLLLNYEKFGR